MPNDVNADLARINELEKIVKKIESIQNDLAGLSKAVEKLTWMVIRPDLAHLIANPIDGILPPFAPSAPTEEE